MITELPDMLFEAISIDSCSLDRNAIKILMGRAPLHFQYSTEMTLCPTENRISVSAHLRYIIDGTPLLQMTATIPFIVPNLQHRYRVDEHSGDIVFRQNLVPELLSQTAGTVRGLLAAKVQGTKLVDYPLPLYSSRMLIEANRLIMN